MVTGDGDALGKELEYMGAEDERPPATGAAKAPESTTPGDTAPPDAEHEAPPSPWLGRIIDDRYRIMELLAEGGMGTVFIAEHLKLRKVVALKTIHPGFLGNEEVAARFSREATATAQLEHPHVASAMDYGALPEGGAYLVLELVRGPSLRAQIDSQGAASWRQACEIAAQIADALSAAHAMGIVHRDLKPENVLLEARHGGSPIVKVLDFGIARVRDGGTQAPGATRPGRALTRVGAVMGTPGYMAPEQAVGDIADERADLYALGVILWEMLAGHCLFDAPNLTGILTQQFASTTPSTRLSQEQPTSIPLELAGLLDRLLAPVPGNRIRDAVEVRDTLRTLASRDATGDTEAYSVAVPTVVRKAAPKVRTALHTVLARTPTRVRMLLAKAVRQFKRWLRTAIPYGRAWTLQTRSWLERLPRKIVWAISGAALILVASLVTASAIVAPDKAPPPNSTAQQDGSSKDVRAPAQARDRPSLKREVQARIDVLSQSRRRNERRAAARWIQKPVAETEIPPFARALARLELGPDCRARTAALRRLRSLGDLRSLPAVAYWHSKPRSGCGVLENRDCYVCLRSELGRTHRTLQRKNKARTASR